MKPRKPIAYENQEDRQNQARALSYLALAYQHLGDWPVADEAIAQSLQLVNDYRSHNYRDLPNSQAVILAQVLNIQATLQFNRGEAEAALSP